MQKKIRGSGIELLRIILMVQIIILHIYGYANVSDTMADIGGGVSFKGDLFWSFCRTPVNVFIVITGFFLVNSAFNFSKVKSKVIRVYLPMIFYSLVIAFIFWFTQPFTIKITPSEVLKAFMPFFSREWYFLSLYILVVLFSPFLNVVLCKLEKKQYQFLLLICFILFSVWPTFSIIKPFDSIISVTQIVDLFGGKSFGSFIFMYIIGGYIKRFTPQLKKPKFIYLLAFIILCLADFGCNFYSGYSRAFGIMNGPFVVAESAFLFMFFKDIDFKSKIINLFGGTTLGVYAIHENPYVRDWLWKIFDFGDKSFYKDGLYLPKFLALAIGIFIVLAIVDMIRQMLFDLIGKLILKAKNKKSV